VSPRCGIDLPAQFCTAKRSAPDSKGSATRKAKAAKTNSSLTPPSKSKRGGKKGVKVRRLLFSLIMLTTLHHCFLISQTAIPTATFKATALPLHVNLTHTPPTIADPESEAVSAVIADPGFVGNLTLVPSSFATGSYGWKGSKRITVELQNPQGEAKEKVQVMLTCVPDTCGVPACQILTMRTIKHQCHGFG
jgi:hypothetical protein